MRVSCLKVVARKVVAKQHLTDPRQEQPSSPLQGGPLLQVLRPAGRGRDGGDRTKGSSVSQGVGAAQAGQGVHMPGVTARDLRAPCLHLCLCWLELPDLGDRKKWGEEGVRRVLNL